LSANKNLLNNEKRRAHRAKNLRTNSLAGRKNPNFADKMFFKHKNSCTTT